jgi:hypothetical protein
MNPKPQMKTIDYYRLELSVRAKNGVNFIIAATLVWTVITFIWTLPYTAPAKGVFTFMAGPLLLPIAWVLSKVFNTAWKVENNPIEPLGLLLNFAQLFYFPILIFIYMKYPQHMVLVYAVITGAHFFPYGWYYKTNAYAVMAGVTTLGALALSLIFKDEVDAFWVPAYLTLCLAILSVWVYLAYKKNEKEFEGISAWPEGA